MRLNFEQIEYIRKQYLNLLNGKLTIEKLNDKLQKHFKVKIDFKEIIQYCQEYNKGYTEITWKFLEV